jgi:hypothetical protein
MPRPRVRASSFVLAGAAALLVAGCGRIDHTAIEDMIRKDLTRKGHAIKSVSCPEQRPVKESAFDCKGVDGSGKAVVFKILYRPTDGGKADVHYSTIIDSNTVSN